MDFLENFIVALALSLVIYLLFVIPNNVEGQSMEPNFHEGEMILTNKVIQWLGPTKIGKALEYDYQRGDVVIVMSHGTKLIKRIVAVGGDVLLIQNNKLYVNGFEIEEQYLPTTVRTRIIETSNKLFDEGENIVVPANNYFVMGDNRENSKDSRFIDVGFIPRNTLIGKVFMRYWPLDKFGIIRTGEYLEINPISN